MPADAEAIMPATRHRESVQLGVATPFIDEERQQAEEMPNPVRARKNSGGTE